MANSELMVIYPYPLVNKQKTIEHGHRNSWWLPINSMVIFRSYVNVYQAG